MRRREAVGPELLPPPPRRPDVPSSLAVAVRLGPIPLLEEAQARAVLREEQHAERGMLHWLRPVPMDWARAITVPPIAEGAAAERGEVRRGQRRAGEGRVWRLPDRTQWFLDYLILANALHGTPKTTHALYAAQLRGGMGGARTSLAHRRIRRAMECGALVNDHPPVHRRERRGHFSPLRLRAVYFPGCPLEPAHWWMASVFAWLRSRGAPAPKVDELLRGGLSTSGGLNALVLSLQAHPAQVRPRIVPLPGVQMDYTDTDNPAQETTRLHVPLVVGGGEPVQKPRSDLRVVHTAPSEQGTEAVSADADVPPRGPESGPPRGPAGEPSAPPATPPPPSTPAGADSEVGIARGGSGRQGARPAGRRPGGEAWRRLLPDLCAGQVRKGLQSLGVREGETPTAAQLDRAERYAVGRLRTMAQRGTLHGCTPADIDAWWAARGEGEGSLR